MTFNATMNQLGNTKNPAQGATHKVLCVCSAGLLRSPTLAQVLNKKYGYNTRAVGTARDFALIPLSYALLHWADEVVFVDPHCMKYLGIEEQEALDEFHHKVRILNTPDCYSYYEPSLVASMLEQYLEAE